MNDNRDPRDDASYQDAPDDLELALRNATRIELSGGAGERHTLPDRIQSASRLPRQLLPLPVEKATGVFDGCRAYDVRDSACRVGGLNRRAWATHVGRDVAGVHGEYRYARLAKLACDFGRDHVQRRFADAVGVYPAGHGSIYRPHLRRHEHDFRRLVACSRA